MAELVIRRGKGGLYYALILCSDIVKRKKKHY